jgi:uncharacterized protein (UPF0333 family)
MAESNLKCGETIYNIDGSCTRRTWEFGRSIWKTYNKNNDLIWSEDNKGNYQMMEYTASGNLSYLDDNRYLYGSLV